MTPVSEKCTEIKSLIALLDDVIELLIKHEIYGWHHSRGGWFLSLRRLASGRWEIHCSYRITYPSGRSGQGYLKTVRANKLRQCREALIASLPDRLPTKRLPRKSIEEQRAELDPSSTLFDVDGISFDVEDPEMEDTR